MLVPLSPRKKEIRLKCRKEWMRFEGEVKEETQKHPGRVRKQRDPPKQRRERKQEGRKRRERQGKSMSSWRLYRTKRLSGKSQLDTRLLKKGTKERFHLSERRGGKREKRRKRTRRFFLALFTKLRAVYVHWFLFLFHACSSFSLFGSFKFPHFSEKERKETLSFLHISRHHIASSSSLFFLFLLFSSRRRSGSICLDMYRNSLRQGGWFLLPCETQRWEEAHPRRKKERLLQLRWLGKAWFSSSCSLSSYVLDLRPFFPSSSTSIVGWSIPPSVSTDSRQ